MADKKKKGFFSKIWDLLSGTEKTKTAEDTSIQDALQRQEYKKYISDRALHDEDPVDYETFKEQKAKTKKMQGG